MEKEEFLAMPLEHSRNLFGQFDCYARKLERTFGVSIINRDEGIKLIGQESAVERSKRVLLKLWELSRRGNEIQEQNVDYAIALSFDNREEALSEIDTGCSGMTAYL